MKWLLTQIFTLSRLCNWVILDQMLIRRTEDQIIWWQVSYRKHTVCMHIILNKLKHQQDIKHNSKIHLPSSNVQPTSTVFNQKEKMLQMQMYIYQHQKCLPLRNSKKAIFLPQTYSIQRKLSYLKNIFPDNHHISLHNFASWKQQVWCTSNSWPESQDALDQTCTEISLTLLELLCQHQYPPPSLPHRSNWEPKHRKHVQV